MSTWQNRIPELPLRRLREQFWSPDRPWLRLSVVAVVLLASFASTYVVGARPVLLMLLMAAVFGAAGVLTLMRWPGLGLFMLAFTGMFTPWLGFNGLNTSMLLVTFLLGLWILDMVVKKKRIILVKSRTLRPVFLLLISSIIAFAIGQFSWFSAASSAPIDAQLGGLMLFVLSAGAFLLAAHHFTNIRWLKAFTWAFIIAGAAYLVVRIIPPLRAPLLGTLFKEGAFDSLFWVWLPVMALSQALLNRKLDPRIRALLFFVVALHFYAALGQSFKWKSGWMPAVAAVGVVIISYSWRVGLLLSLAAGVPLLILSLENIFSTETYSLSTRLDAWVILLEIIKVSPLLGLGFGNYRFYTPLFRIRGWTVAFNSHNNYLDILAQTGLFGLGAFLWLFAEIGLVGWRLRRRVPEGFARAYVYGVLGGTVGTLVAGMLGDWVIPFVYNVTLNGFRTTVVAWVFLGGLVALEALYTNDAYSERT